MPLGTGATKRFFEQLVAETCKRRLLNAIFCWNYLPLSPHLARLLPEQLQTLAAASAPEPVFLHPIFEPAINRSLFGGHAVQGWR